MTRSFVALAAFLALTLQTFAAGGISEIIERERLNVAMLGTDLPPFIYTGSDGKPCGYDVDIAKGAAKELGVELCIDRSAKTFNELIDAVDQGRADMALSKLSRTLDRSKRVVFTEPYLLLHKALLVNRLQLAVRRRSDSISDYVKRLDGTVGVIADSSYEEFSRGMFPRAPVKGYASWPELVRAVDKGEILCAFRDDDEIKRVMRSMPGASIKMLCVVMKDADDPIAIAVGANRMQFRYWLDEYLDERKFRTTSDALLVRYPEVMRLQSDSAQSTEAPSASSENSK